MLENEIRMHRELAHRNVISILDADTSATYEDDERNSFQVGYIVTEYAAAGDLITNLMKNGGLSVPVVKHYGKQLIEGISHMHQEGIAHRDLKLENVLLDANYELKIADFGLSCGIQGEHESGFS